MKTKRVFYVALSVFLVLVIVLIGVWYASRNPVQVVPPVTTEEYTLPIGTPTPTQFLME
jgi:hypothetical protein